MKKHLTILALLLTAILVLTACGGGASAVKPTEELTGGDSMENAQKIAVNTKYHGTYEEGEAWFSFKTGEQEGVKYGFTLTNLTVGSDDLDIWLFDESGEEFEPCDRSYYDISSARFANADEDGAAASSWTDELQPNTTYYLQIEGGSKAEYSLKITDPAQEMVPEAERPAIENAEAYYTATNMDDAPLLTANTKYAGSYTEGTNWVAFRTGEAEDVRVTVTLDNHTAGSDDLCVWVFDEYGRELEPDGRTYYDISSARFADADADGTAASGWSDELQPNTTYFLQIGGDSKVGYSIRVTDPSQEAGPEEERTTVADNETYFTATNMDDAPLLATNTRFHGNYTDGAIWVAFRTGSEEGVNYSFTLEDLTVGSDGLTARLFDRYGEEIPPKHRSYSEVWSMFVDADDSGTARTGWIDTLEPDSTYFFRITGDSKAEYILQIGDPTAGETEVADPSSVESNVDKDMNVVPGTSMSTAVKVPLGTKVYGKYTDGYAWLAFTTTDVENAEYYVTMVNQTAGSENLTGRLYDEYGAEQSPDGRSYREIWSMMADADQDGTAVSGRYISLQPNATYYLRLDSDSKVKYSVCVSSPEQASSAYKTSSNLENAVPPLGENDEFFTGTNQNEATMLKTNVRYHGKYQDGYAWVSFTTGDAEDVEYSITLENLTPGSEYFILQLYDEYGYKLLPDRRSYREIWERFVAADQSGTAVTGWTKALKPDTTYYIRLESDSMPDKLDYVLLIGEPKPQQESNTIAEEPEEPEPEEEVVFEVPFELNETQVRFVADQATFIDEAAAKEALEPVAKVILEHPDHKILLAGTTATFGDQAACVKLSNARAEAVKNMLVNTFGVPADQLLTVGLGYKDDPFERGRDVDSNGKFVPTEAAKNRRVIVMDAETDIAKQVLGN